MPNDHAADTQFADDVDQIDDASLDTTDDGGSGGDDQPFLVINDRTKYTTREDAVKAYDEAGKRISALSAWEKEASTYGLKDPRQLTGLINEYLQLKRAAANGGTNANAAQGAAPKAAATHSDDDLTPEEQAGLKWLQKMAPKLGYVPKTELDAVLKKLEDKVGSLQQFASSTEEAHLDATIEQGRTTLKSLLTDAKLPTDADFMEHAEDFMTAYVEKDEARMKAFKQGGPAFNAVIAEGFKKFKASIDRIRAGATSAYAKGKNDASSRNGRPLPRTQQAAARGANAPNRPAAPAKAAGLTPAIHEAAFAAAQKAWGEGSSDQ